MAFPYIGVNLGIVPYSLMSQLLFASLILLSAVGVLIAIKRNATVFYAGGVVAAFMEEFIYRGVVYALVYKLSSNVVAAIAVSSIAFGLWHLKNVPLFGVKVTVRQVLMTGFVYGPVFGLIRYWTGDVWLVSILHFLNDAYCAFFPKLTLFPAVTESTFDCDNNN